MSPEMKIPAVAHSCTPLLFNNLALTEFTLCKTILPPQDGKSQRAGRRSRLSGERGPILFWLEEGGNDDKAR